MENTSSASMLIFALIGLLAVILIVWLIYRNIKDEKKYEKNMDDPARDLPHDEGEKT